MNNLIIIGNGFDLAHGMETSYTEFLLWFLNNAVMQLKSQYGYSDEVLTITSPLTIKFNEGRPFSAINMLLDALARNNIGIKGNSKFIEEVFKTSYSGYWVDIEYSYYRSLISALENLTPPFLRRTPFLKNVVTKTNSDLQYITIKLVEYLKSDNVTKAQRNQEISQVLSSITGNNYYNQNTKEVKENSTLILNFNYTKTINLYDIELGLGNNRSKIINIHGEIDSKVNPIIFGYGDEMDPFYPTLENLNMNSILDHIKSFHYLKTTNHKELMNFINSGEKFKVSILGHSCGISDRVLLNAIFEHDKCQEIQIYYHQREDGTNDFFEKTQEISRHFRPENKAKMRNKIVPFDKCEPLVRPSKVHRITT